MAGGKSNGGREGVIIEVHNKCPVSWYLDKWRWCGVHYVGEPSQDWVYGGEISICIPCIRKK